MKLNPKIMSSLGQLSSKTGKEISWLVAKWAFKYGSRVYGTALNYSRNVEMAVIPNKIGKKLITSNMKMAALAPLRFTNTFSLFPQYHSETQQAFAKWETIIKNTTNKVEKQRLQKAMADEIYALSNKWNLKIGIQSWIDVLTFFIPIPFSGVFG